MKKVFFIGFISALPLFTFAQNESATPTIDKRLYDVFELNDLDKMQKENPTLIRYYNFFLDNSYNIIELPDDKTTKMKTVIIEDFTDFNILKLINDQQLTRSQDAAVHYKIKNSKQVLELISGKVLIEQFNQYVIKGN
jgi:hypothetical protein